MTTQMQFAEVARQFVAGLDTAYAHRSSDRLSENTRRLYSRYAYRAAAMLGKVPLTQINAQHVRDYVETLRRGNVAAKRSASETYSLVSARDNQSA
jgi:hypothetical protein